MTTKTKKVLDLPVPESGCGDIRITGGPVELLVEYEYKDADDAMDRVGAIQFQGVIAFQFRDEMHCGGVHKESYDTLVEVRESTWKKQIQLLGASTVHKFDLEKKHFAIFFDSNGYLEVLADGFQELPAKFGRLESTK